jgi:hypothetical protein
MKKGWILAMFFILHNICEKENFHFPSYMITTLIKGSHNQTDSKIFSGGIKGKPQNEYLGLKLLITLFCICYLIPLWCWI